MHAASMRVHFEFERVGPAWIKPLQNVDTAKNDLLMMIISIQMFDRSMDFGICPIVWLDGENTCVLHHGIVQYAGRFRHRPTNIHARA
jgi:hypothetical protein